MRDLVAMHRGTVEVSSAVGRGTAFTIHLKKGTDHLPREQISRQRGEPGAGTSTTAAAFAAEAMRWVPAAPERGDPVPASLGAQTGAERIVLADDNADMREYITRLLQERWRVEAVSNGVEALAAIRRERPDLVLTDVMMPMLDGFGLLSALREDPALASLPVVMLSARAGEESRVEGLEAGADDYLVKPFSARELVARVSTHLSLGRFRAAAESERAKLYELFWNVPVAITVCEGPELRLAFMNELARQIVHREDVVGRPLLEAFPELRGQPVVDELQEVFRTGVHQSFVEMPATLIVDGTMQQRFFTTSRRPLRDSDGRITGVIAAGYDVTEAVRTRAELERAARAKDEFLAMLGHELRNPLAPIVTALDLARAHGATPRILAILERQTGHLKRLVDDLLDVSRITQGKLELARAPVELMHVLERAVEMAQPLLEERTQTLSLEGVPAGLVVDGDRERLAQVFANLLTNAAKYSDKGRGIAIRATSDAQRVVVDVVDSGMGIMPDMLSGVFDPFVQQSQGIDRARGGLGLGLAIVKSIVAMHGGSVAASSPGPGQGSTFTVILPRATTHAAAVTRLPTPSRERSGKDDVVLVVDDNADAADMVAAALEVLGYEAETANDGKTALEAFDRLRPRIALLDIGLPDVDGYELAKRLRARAAGEPLHLVALTGYGQPSDRARALAAGFDVHLVKPVDVNALASALESGRAARGGQAASST